MYETIKIKKIGKVCPACEGYAEKHRTNPPKTAIIACEGACSKGEVARIAANLIASELAREDTVRICLGGAFTVDAGQRDLVRRAQKTIAIEGCYLSCSSRMMEGVLPGLKPVVVQSDRIYDGDLPFELCAAPEGEIRRCALRVAKTVARDHIGEAACARTATLNPRCPPCKKA